MSISKLLSAVVAVIGVFVSVQAYATDVIAWSPMSVGICP
jgi:hypothetical protein